jgi:hypothetical protein
MIKATDSLVGALPLKKEKKNPPTVCRYCWGIRFFVNMTGHLFLPIGIIAYAFRKINILFNSKE